MTRTEWIELFTTGMDKPHTKGVIYTEEQVDEIIKRGERITSICYTDDDGKDHEFFTNNHIFAYPAMGNYWCSCSMGFPISVVPRPGCEDGIIDNFAKYKVVHGSDFYMWSYDELIDYLATLGMVKGEGLDA